MPPPLEVESAPEAPAIPVEAVDGTGCGDAWDAGFLCGLMQGWDLERTAHFANAVGGMCATEVGATAGPRIQDSSGSCP